MGCVDCVIRGSSIIDSCSGGGDCRGFGFVTETLVICWVIFLGILGVLLGVISVLLFFLDFVFRISGMRSWRRIRNVL